MDSSYTFRFQTSPFSMSRDFVSSKEWRALLQAGMILEWSFLRYLRTSTQKDSRIFEATDPLIFS